MLVLTLFMRSPILFSPVSLVFILCPQFLCLDAGKYHLNKKIILMSPHHMRVVLSHADFPTSICDHSSSSLSLSYITVNDTSLRLS